MERHRSQLRTLLVGNLELRNPATGASVDRPAINWQSAIQSIAPIMSLDDVKIYSLQDEFQWSLIEDDAQKYTLKYPKYGYMKAGERWLEHLSPCLEVSGARGLGCIPLMG